jgi:hypothetical protein
MLNNPGVFLPVNITDIHKKQHKFALPFMNWRKKLTWTSKKPLGERD